MDRAALLWVVEHRLGPLDPVFVGIGLIGSGGVIWIALAPLLTGLARRPMRSAVLLTAGTVWTAELLTFGIKAATGRPRPFQTLTSVDPLVAHTTGTSFPSGHAATSFAGAVVLAWLMPRLVPALIALATLFAFSRVYVGVHYPSDVLAGALIGATIGLTAIALVSSCSRRGAAREQPRGDVQHRDRR